MKIRLIMKYLFTNHSSLRLTSIDRIFFNKRNLFYKPKDSVLLKTHLLQARNMGTSHEGVSLPTLLQVLTNFAPLSLAESWDNVGVLVKPSTVKNISKALLTIDLTEDVMEEAVNENVDMIISYHPPIFAALKRITDSGWKERIVAKCLENKIVLFSPHTSWDSVKNGLTDWLASCFDNESVKPIQPFKTLDRTNSSAKYSMSVYCPQQHTEALNSLLLSRNCQLDFRSQADSKGIVKYDLLCSMEDIDLCMQRMEGCGCVYNVQERVSVVMQDNGSGRVCRLKQPITLTEAVDKVKQLVGLPHVRLALAAGKTKESKIESVAVVAGSGASLLRGVKADLYVTGEMLHHDILDANHNNASVILINHSDSERGFLKVVAPRFEKELQSKVKFVISKKDKDPLVTV